MAELLPYLVAMGILVLGSAFFAGSETALFSLSRGARDRLARSQRSSERAVANLLRDPRKLIATILIGNELINIAFSSLAASAVERTFEARGIVVGGLVLTLVSAGVAVPFLLLFGEITPKTIGLALAEGWAKLAAPLLRVWMVLVTPARWITTGIAGGAARLFGAAATQGPRKLGEADFKAMVDVGSEAGELHATERRLIHNVFEFGDRAIAEIMTPVKEVFSLPIDRPLQRIVGEVARSGFSRVPVHRGRKQEIVGVLFAKDLVGWSSGRLAQKTLAELLRPAIYVPKTSTCAQVFAEFQRARTHLAMVVDEYGRQVGLVTMEDLLLELFGGMAEEAKKPRGPASGAMTVVSMPPGADEGGS
jgi:putative hemolysin